MNGYGAAADGILFFVIAKLLQPAEKGVPHPTVGKTDAHVHREGIRSGKLAQLKTGEPPVEAFAFEKDPPVFTQDKTHGKAFFILGAVVKRSGKVFGTNVILIGIVDPYLRSGGDAVLALPQLDHPAFSRMGEADGFAVHHHIEQGGSFVIELAVAHFPLPAVQEGIKDVPFSVVGKACFLQITVQLHLLDGFILCGTKPPRPYFESEEKYEKRGDENSGDTE